MNTPQFNWSKYLGRARDFGIEVNERIDTEVYTSAAIYEVEKEKLFRKTWLVVARVTEVAKPGDYIKRDIPMLDTQVVIVRDRTDGMIRAFYNACAHRGVALVSECHGATALFVCPYHGWAYGTDGKLKSMPGPENFPQVDKNNAGLRPIHCDIWNEYIFLNFDHEPKQTLAEYLGEFGKLYDDLPFTDYTYAVDIIQEAPTNWKNFLDAFNEGYHVRVLHSKSLIALFTSDNPFTEMYDQGFMAPHSRATIQRSVDYAPTGKVEQFVASIPLGVLEAGAAGPRLCGSARGVNRVGLPNFNTELMNFFPLSQFHAFSDRYLWFQFWPMGPDKVRFVTRNYFARKPASYREAFAEAFYMAKSRDVVSEDVAMTYIQQIGMKGGGVKTLNIGENEPLIRFNHLQIQKYLNGEV